MNKNRFRIGKHSVLLRIFPALLIATLMVELIVEPAEAHHSVAGQFDMRNPVEWTGVISKIDWINPHSYLYLDVTEDDGSINTWQLETLPTAMFRKANMTKEMVMGGGQEVTITGLTARDGSKNLGYIIRINYADGHFYQLSADPRP